MKFKSVILILPAIATEIFFVFYLLSQNTHPLLSEDGLIENLQILMLGMAIFYSWRIFSLKNLSYRKIFFVVASILSVILCEEISWGQRIINFEAPKIFLAHNVQQEFNFHNLSFIIYKNNTIMMGLMLFSGLTILSLHLKPVLLLNKLFMPEFYLFFFTMLPFVIWTISQVDNFIFNGTSQIMKMQEVHELLFYSSLMLYIQNLYSKQKKLEFR